MATLNFLPGNTHPIDIAGSYRVYFKSRWNEGWGLAETGFLPTQIVWSCAPSIPVATLEHYYGHQRQTEDQDWASVLRTSGTDHVGDYVKIEVDCEELEAGGFNTRTWYGIVDAVEDQAGGIEKPELGGRAWGLITLKCYGLEKVLADHVIDYSVIDQPDGVKRVNRAFDFNMVAGRKEFANRSNQKYAGVYVFANQAPVNFWRTREIVEYLLYHQTPRDQFNVRSLQFQLAPTNHANLPPNWDLPQLQANGRTTYDVLTSLIDRRRLMTFWFDVDEGAAGIGGKVQLHINTMSKLDIAVNLPEAQPIPANSKQYDISHERDQRTSVALQASNVPVVDEVIARGAPVRAVCTVSLIDDSLEKGWSKSDEAEYEVAASGNNYNGELIGTAEKQRRNAEVRGNEKFKDIFAKFCLPHTWDFTTKAGDAELNAEPVFINAVGEVDTQAFFHTFIEQTLPLLSGVVYRDDVIAEGQVNEDNSPDGEEMRPLVIFRRPDKKSGQSTERWVRADRIGKAAHLERAGAERAKQNERFTIHVEVPQFGHCLRLRVQGQPQHAIAGADFDRLPVDQFLGNFSYSAMIATISLEGQQWCEGKFPADLAVETDHVRRKIIYAGTQYTKDYVAKNTVVDVNEKTGQLERSTGGYIPKPGPSDNEKKLEAVAKIAWHWYSKTHYILALSSASLYSPALISLGDMVNQLGTDFSDDELGNDNRQEINSTITQITFEIPRGTGGEPPSRTMQILTWAGELDIDGPTEALAGAPIRRPPPGL